VHPAVSIVLHGATVETDGDGESIVTKKLNVVNVQESTICSY
jgi:hypothetical protein